MWMTLEKETGFYWANECAKQEPYRYIRIPLFLSHSEDTLPLARRQKKLERKDIPQSKTPKATFVLIGIHHGLK